MLKLVEQCAGVGELVSDELVFRPVSYRVSRFQGMTRAGMPVPGMHRIEGSVDLRDCADRASLAGRDLKLRLDDGRTLAITLAGEDGRIYAEGHGPKHGCSCC